MEELSVETLVEVPLERWQKPFLEVSPREDLRVLVPGAIENPAATEATHATHALESRGEKVELQWQRVGAHFRLATRIELLEPGIFVVYALERML
jgi:hypothetical protein